MRSFAGLWWRARHATVPLLLPGLLCLAAAIAGQALNVSGVNVVRVWDLAGAAPPQEFTGHTVAVRAVAVSGDGRTAVSGGTDGIRVWDLADDRKQARWIADAAVQAVAVNAVVIVAGDTAGQVHALQLNVPTAASA